MSINFLTQNDISRIMKYTKHNINEWLWIELLPAAVVPAAVVPAIVVAASACKCIKWL